MSKKNNKRSNRETFPGQGRAGRAKMGQRCRQCALHEALCICDQIEKVSTRTRVLVISHQKEICKSTNTGRLVPLVLEQGEIRIRGRVGERLKTDDIFHDDQLNLLLYPSEGSVVLNDDVMSSDHSRALLIVPDGNWSQARKVTTREPGLKGLLRVHLPPGPGSSYRLRHHADPSRLATFEAVARALGIIEGLDIQRSLERIFDLLVERTLWTRGQLKAEQVTGGIPAAALEFRKRSSSGVSLDGS
jgi:DTW domain-containing protein